VAGRLGGLTVAILLVIFLWSRGSVDIICCTVVYLCLCYIALIEMAPRKRSKNDAGTSSSQAAFDEHLFVNQRAFERYKLLSGKNVIQDRGMECKDEYRHEPQYDEIKRQIVGRGGRNW
jgi:Ca2+/Na+ antiporter